MNASRLAVATVTAVASATVLLTAGGAAAAPKGVGPDDVRTANPAQACAAIEATLAGFGVTATDFDVISCVRDVAREVPNVAFGDPYEQCATPEAGTQTPGGFFQITYPYVFHAEPGDPFPNLRANNREQCARALYAFHTIESYLPEMPPPGT
jgi:hypothetical protein